MTTALTHRTVLLDEAVAHLLPAADDSGSGELSAATPAGTPSNTPALATGIYIDGTFGRGGHSRLLLSRLAPDAQLHAFDKDAAAIAEAATILDPRFHIHHCSFAGMQAVLAGQGITRVDGVLLDLGISSPQVDEAERGFSFRADGPLDMRMDTSRGMSAAQWLAIEDENKIEKVIRDYGEERFAFQIAKAIVARRTVEPISGTRQLAQIVAQAVKTREKGKDPATRTFQAIRIFINQELEDLEAGLKQAFDLLAPHGRLVAISFHSLEDRIVKQFMASKVKVEQPDRRLPIRAVDLPQPEMKLILKTKPSSAEVDANPRARSAVMRVAERLPSSGAAGPSGVLVAGGASSASTGKRRRA